MQQRFSLLHFWRGGAQILPLWNYSKILNITFSDRYVYRAPFLVYFQYICRERINKVQDHKGMGHVHSYIANRSATLAYSKITPIYTEKVPILRIVNRE